MRFSAGSPSWLAGSLSKCAALLRAVYRPSATERPIGTILEEKVISSRFRISILGVIWTPKPSEIPH